MEKNPTNTIGKDYTLLQLVKFVSPAVITKLLLSLLSTLDDSLFISRYCGKNALAAFSMALPWFMLLDVLVMIISATGAKCSMLMGEKKNDEANSVFTTMCIVSLVCGFIVTLILLFFKKPLLVLLGETENLMPYITDYLNVSQFYMPLYFLTQILNRFYIISGKPKMSMNVTLLQAFSNLFFDYIFVAKMQVGIVGAAYSNLIANVIISIIGVIFFASKKQEVHFAKPIKKPFKLLKEIFILGKSQGLTSLSVSINTFIVNYIIMKAGGESFVAAFTIVNNIQFMFMNAFFGFVGSTSPMVAYAYGEKNAKKLAKVIKQAVLLIECLSILVGLFIALNIDNFVYLYFIDQSDSSIIDLVKYGLKVAPYCYSIFSFNILVQEFSIAVGNSKASTFLSILENIVFANLTIIIMPKLFGLESVWYQFLVSEAITLIFTIYVVYINKDNYGYGETGISKFDEM